MKFMNVISKFGSHKDYVDYRNTMLGEAENLLNEGKMEEYKAKVEDIKTFDNEYTEYTEAKANIQTMQGAVQVPNVMTNAAHAGAVAGVVDKVNFSEDAVQEDFTNSTEYRKSFMNYVLNGTAMPAKFSNADESTSTSDVGAVIPTTILNKIIEKMENVGNLLNKVTRTFYKGGVQVPTSSAKPVATWTTEHGTSDKQKKALGSISFTYFKLRCVVSVGIITDTVALEVFERTLTQNVANAMVKAIEESIIKGDGTTQPKGILKEKAPEGQDIEITEDDNITYADLCSMEAALPEEYENGAEYFMPKKTFYEQITAMVDSQGQPIARTNVGINGKPEYTILGRKVNFCKYVPAFAKSVTEDTVVAFIFNPEDYMLNTNMNVTVKKYEDHDTDDQITKAIMLVDGKVIDTNSLVTMTVKNS